ncbi:MAG: two-component system response regulator DegU [Cyclobacteriaceae bacterium]|jgi:two-component system response regulator DegU
MPKITAMDQDLNVLIADDHTLFRKGMVMMLKTFPGIKSVHDAENGQKALDLMKDVKIDIVLLDIDMPVLDGKDTARKILSKYSDCRIIMVSMHDSLSTVSELIDIGVHGYLLKSGTPKEVQTAIQFVRNNDFYYNQIVAKALKNTIDNHLVNGEKSGVTRRESEILRLICEELTMREIGEKLFISEKTIHTHRKNLMKKTHAKNAVGLVKYAIQHKIVSFE